MVFAEPANPYLQFHSAGLVKYKTRNLETEVKYDTCILQMLC